MSDDPFVGTWKLNPARSEFDPNHRPREATMTFERQGDGGYLLRAAGVDEKGEHCEEPQRLVPDGEPHAVEGLKGLTSVCTRNPSTRLQTDVRREDGSPVGQAIYEVSEDGRSLSATSSGFDSQLRQFRQFTVWDRQ